MKLVDGALRYVLHSASGVAGYRFKEIPGEAVVVSPEAFRSLLMQRIAKVHAVCGADGEPPLKEVSDKLADIGHWLYRRLFPEQMRVAYSRFRTKVTTLQIISDEPWIPWELVKPFDDGESPTFDRDDFLCMQFQLTRWLAGDTSPAPVVSVDRLAVFETGKPWRGVALSSAAEVRDRVTNLAASRPDDADVRPEELDFSELKTLLREERLDLLHFAGHIDDKIEQPEEARIGPANGPQDLAAIGPLVFFNSCREPQQGWALTSLGSWADGWVRDFGCGAFVAPQWKISARLGRAFADAFYTALDDGQTFGQAARSARRELREAEPGRLAWLAYNVFAHPNGRLVLGPEDLTSLLGTQPAHTVPAEIRKHVIDASSLIEEKTQGFVSRRWVFDLIDRFVDKHPQGYFQLLGDPGIGKTALMAEMVKRAGHIHHFNVRADGITRPETFLANICAQLIATYRLEYESLPREATRDATFLSALLEQISKKLRPEEGKVILLVDALDEADHTLLPAGANTLYLPSTLPQGVYVVATFRRTSPPLRIDCGQQVFNLDQDDDGNLTDVKEYVKTKVELPGIRGYLANQNLDEEDFVVDMVEKSQGNFMYLHHVLPAITRGIYRDREFATLPVGLVNYTIDSKVMSLHVRSTHRDRTSIDTGPASG